MVDLNALNAILSTRNGVWTLVVLVFILLWRGWQYVPAIITAWSARRKALADEKDADWTRIRGEAKLYADEAHRYSDRLAAVERREDECREQLRDALHRLAQVEGFMMGQGKARQEAANIVAIERLTDKQNGDKGEGK
jgi:hypothetical protein